MTPAPRSADRAALAAVAAVAVVVGLLAVATGSAVLAVVAGAASVVAGVLGLRVARTRPTVRSAGTGQARPEQPTEDSSGGPIPLPAVPRPAAPPADGPPPGPYAAPGLLTEEFFLTTLQGRVAVARRALRPLSLVYFEVLELAESSGKRPVARQVVAETIRSTLREADSAGVVGVDGYACVLEDTDTDGAVWTAERIRRNLADADPGRRFRAGIASYPNHGLDVTELQAKARLALDAARDWSRDRIEVATATG